MKALLLSLFLLGGAFSTAEAQVLPSPGLCDSAAKAVRGQRLRSRSDSTTPLWWHVLSGCDEGDRVAAAALRSNAVKQETDPDRYEEFFVMFGARRSREFFDAYSDLVRDGSSSSAMKLQALQQLGWMFDPGVLMISGGLERLTDPSLCGTRRLHVDRNGPSTLPSDYLKQLIDIMQETEVRKSNDSAVRAMAHCWRVELVHTLPPDPEKIGFKHVCGDTFIISNRNPVNVVVAYDVEGTSERRSISVPANDSVAFAAISAGAVRLYFGSRIIGRGRTSDKLCLKGTKLP